MTVIFEFGLVHVPQMATVHFMLHSFSNYIRPCLLVYTHFNVNYDELEPVAFTFQQLRTSFLM